MSSCMGGLMFWKQIQTFQAFMKNGSVPSRPDCEIRPLKIFWHRIDRLFSMLRYNMNVIGFWLSTKAYPREAKTIENKLKCTTWDLCSKSLKHCVTGFSSTNDTENILSLPVAQNDLNSLQQTNERLLKTLLRQIIRTNSEKKFDPFCFLRT